MKKLWIFLVLLFSFSVFAQNEEKCACSKKDKDKVTQYFAEIAQHNKFIAECEQKNKAEQRPVIANRCEWGGSGCPVKLLRPEFPSNAKKLKISGIVKVEIIIDEKGFVIYSKMIEGNKIFKKSAETAACKSRFTPFYFCGKSIKNKLFIEYNFET